MTTKTTTYDSRKIFGIELGELTPEQKQRAEKYFKAESAWDGVWDPMHDECECEECECEREHYLLALDAYISLIVSLDDFHPLVIHNNGKPSDLVM